MSATEPAGFSERFQKRVWITSHAALRMLQRSVSQVELLNLIETGELRHKDASHCWIYRSLAGREDNLVCTAVHLDSALIVKTVMINWQLQEVPT
ncbi:DUF4258 domain-containing protein [Stagnimonas aquatica]|uniref:DUF4258 domain-containing protein n=1 Tax=Stagnimonas aquatica TaxID=2689987 RepID=A0A3N0V4V8_9GAMM|nr:DUF4258 domain-containing protein [Stagnimonas aquatica]ROH87837.1 DUF4258 domain-containing protein [Stagnimonas aquatica]